MQPVGCLLDEHIREALKTALRKEDSAAAIIDELPLLRGKGRADLAFINGELCGFEIKSEADSLVRLGVQASHYENIFEFSTLVATTRHLAHARERIPSRWGLIEATHANGNVTLRVLRAARRNPNLSNSALARLLWKNECIYLLRKAELPCRPTAPVIELWNLVQSLSTEQLCHEVREALKRREARAAARRTPSDGSRTIAAIE